MLRANCGRDVFFSGVLRKPAKLLPERKSTEMGVKSKPVPLLVQMIKAPCFLAVEFVPSRLEVQGFVMQHILYSTEAHNACAVILKKRLCTW